MNGVERRGDATRRTGPFMEETWLDEARDEAPDEVLWRRKGKDFGGKEENIEHSTFNIECRSLEGRKGKFETKLG